MPKYKQELNPKASPKVRHSSPRSDKCAKHKKRWWMNDEIESASHLSIYTNQLQNNNK